MLTYFLLYTHHYFREKREHAFISFVHHVYIYSSICVMFCTKIDCSKIIIIIIEKMMKTV